MNIKKAFTILELAIVVTITAITLSVVSSGYSAYYTGTKTLANTATVKNLGSAIDIYFAKNGYIPCPADPTLPVTDSNFGIERLDSTGTGCAGASMVGAANKPYPFQNQSRTGSANYFLFGSVPTRSMGLPDNAAIDSYGNRITYVVHDSIANYKRHSSSVYQNLYGYGNLILTISGDTTGSMFSQSSSCGISQSSTVSSQYYVALFGDTTISTSSQNHYRTVMAACNAQMMNSITNAVVTSAQNNLAFVLISHGKSGKGGWNYSGGLNPLPTNPMELSNSYANYINPANGAINSANYVFNNTGVNSKPLKFYQGTKTATFDNYVVWRTIPDLLAANNSAVAIYCHPSTHPGFLAPPAPNTYANAVNHNTYIATPPTLTKNGTNYTLNGISKTCTGYGTWI